MSGQELWRKVVRHLDNSAAVASALTALALVVLLIAPGVSDGLTTKTGLDEERLLVVVPALTLLVTLALYSVVGFLAARRRPEIEQVCRAYDRRAASVRRSLPGGRVIRLTPAPPITEVEDAGPGPDRLLQRAKLVARAYGKNESSFVKAWKAAPPLEEDSSHLILPDPPWLARHGDNVWIDPLARIERLSGVAANYKMIQVLTSEQFTPDRATRWDRVARVSGNALLVCPARRELILHLRHPKHAYGEHLHMVGGNFEPDHDNHNLVHTAIREGLQETGLHFSPHRAPCLLMQEEGTNWHMAVFLGVAVGREQVDAMRAGLAANTWNYAKDEGVPCPVKLDDLEAVMRRPMVPSCYMAICAWLLAGAPVDGQRGVVMRDGAARALAKRLIEHPAGPNFIKPA